MGFREARIKAGKTVREVMFEMGVSDAAVYMWESGENKPQADKLPKLAKLYGCTVDELLKEDSDV